LLDAAVKPLAFETEAQGRVVKVLRASLMFVAILAAALVVGCGGAKLSGTPASNVVWEGGFGLDSASADRMYILLGAGFIRAPTSDDLDTIVADWSDEHPKAEVVLAADYGSMFTDQPSSKLYWVWLVDGESCLNVELVRQGACAAGTMGVPDIPDTDPPELLVSEEQYQDFRDQVLEAEKQAREERLGVWADSPRTETESSDSWSVAEPWDGPEPSPPMLFPVRQGTKWGYIDRTGTLVIDFKYDDAGSFSEGLASVKVGDVWGCIDESGSIVIAPQYENPLWFSNGLARVWTSVEKGYIDRSGTLVIRNDPEWDWTSDFSEGLAAVGFEYTMSSDVGYIDTNGKLVIKIAGADSARDFSEGLAVVRQGGYGYIGRNGRFVIDPQFYEADEFTDGLAVVEIESYFDEEKRWLVSQYQIIDTHGNAVVTLDGYSTVGSLREGRAYAFLADAFGISSLPAPGEEYVPPVAVGFIDETGALVIPVQFTNAGDFAGGLAQVTCANDKMAYIDLDGNFVWQEK
jgi:hypothetical protein